MWPRSNKASALAVALEELAAATDGSDTKSSQTVLYDTILDNESSQYCHYYNSHVCENQNEYTLLISKCLHWCKVILFKIAKSYHAFPVVLVFLPLLVGLTVGYYLGSRRRIESERFPTPSNRESRGNSSLFSFRSALRLSWNLLWSKFSTFGTSVTSDRSDKGISINMSRTPAPLSASSKLPKQTSEKIGGSITEVSKRNQQRVPLLEREQQARSDLEYKQSHLVRECTFPRSQLPQHVAVIMDGNRRYGREKYGDECAGHWDGCRKLLEMCTWCQAEGIPELTVYAFSTENWNRPAPEVQALMALFLEYSQQLRVQAMEKRICVRVIATDTELIPANVRQALDRLQADTEQFQAHNHLRLNVCLSYGSRGEIVQTCQQLARDCIDGTLHCEEITETTFGNALGLCGDPDLLIRTSGEVRLSNFLLWQLAYAELFFVEQKWPEWTKQDFLQVLQSFANGRQRRFGK